MITNHAPISLASLVLLLSACEVSHREGSKSDTTYLQAIQAPNAWWQAFKDPLHDAAISVLLSENRDLKGAIARLREAKALTETASASLLPNIGISTSATRSNENNQKAYGQVKGGVESAWEVDLFGTNRASLDAAEARESNALASLHDVQNALMASTVRTLQEWRYYTQRLKTTEKLIILFTQQLQLLSDQARAGLIDETALSQIRVDLSNTQKSLVLLRADLKTRLYQLQTLLNRSEDEVQTILLKHPEPPLVLPHIDAVLNVSVESLKNRPDIRAAEASLLASHSDLKSAEAALWPKLNLSSFFGIKDGSSTLMATGPQAWTVAGTLSLPILDFGRLRSAAKAADARAEQAQHTLEQKILGALEETRTALVTYLESGHAYAHIMQAITSRADATHLAKQRFDSGLTSMQTLLSAEIQLEQATLDHLSQKLALDLSYIQLNKALAQGFTIQPQSKND